MKLVKERGAKHSSHLECKLGYCIYRDEHTMSKKGKSLLEEKAEGSA